MTKVHLAVSFERPKQSHLAVFPGVPIRSPAVSKPVFFGATSKDAICIPKLQIPVAQKACPNLIVHEFDTGHWVQLERKDEVNKELGAWFKAVLASASS